MSSTFGSLEIAKSGLSVAMSNLEITGHNIANANTVGYTRQRLITSSIEPSHASYLLSQVNANRIGRGVEITDIQQIRSAYLDDQYRDLNADYNYSKYRTQALTYLEGLFNSELAEGEGLTGSIEDFYAALKDFAFDTTSEEYRTAVQQASLSLTENFNVVYEEMSDLWNDQNSSISTVADAINSIAQQISELNEAISSYERNGETANDLRDDRNLLLDQLSAYVNISYSNNENNPSMLDVQIGGIDLVTGVSYHTIEVANSSDHTAEIDALTAQIAVINQQIEDSVVTAGDGQALIADLVDELRQYLDVTTDANADNPDLVDVSFKGVSLVSGTDAQAIEQAVESDMPAWSAFYRNNLTLDGQALSIEAGTVSSGQLYSNMEMIISDGSDTSMGAGILYYMDKLNDLARSIAETINAIHSTGYTYPTESSASVSGVNLFYVSQDADGNEDYTKITAGNFTISDEVMASVWNIAGSSAEITEGNTNSGNSAIAEELYETMNSGGFYGSLNALVSHLSIALYTSEGIEDTKDSLLNSVDTQRTSISGVSVNEEATNLIVYQQSYNACARVLTTLDEMLEVLISNTGVVGR